MATAEALYLTEDSNALYPIISPAFANRTICSLPSSPNIETFILPEFIQYTPEAKLPSLKIISPFL